jgi:hypothetical protein
MLWLWKACSFALASCDPRVRKTGAAGGVGLLRDCETDVDPPLDCECECSGPFDPLYHLNFFAATGGSSDSGLTTRTNLATSSSCP